jgi:serine/threonine-protein kinase
VALALVAALGLASAASGAPTPSEVATAEALFREAKALLEQGKYAEACPKLAESQRIDPAGGTLFALALCYEADGKTASAWAVFNEAKAVAERDRRADRVKSAGEHLAALERKLSFLKITVAPEAAKLPGLELRRDDATIGRAVFGVAVPVDPGKHVIVASAAGYKPITIEVDVGPTADRKTVEIPALEPAPPPEPAPTAPPLASSAPPAPTTPPTSTAPPIGSPPGGDADSAADPGSGRRTAALILGGAGVVSLGVGAVFGFRAKSQHDDAIERCPASPCGDPEGVSLNQSAQTSALVANITIGAGIAAASAGAILWLTAPRAAPKPASSLGPRVTAALPAALPGGAYVSVAGVF